MRLAILAIFLSTAPFALGQAATPEPGSSQQSLLMPSGSTRASLNLRDVPQIRQFNLDAPKDAKIFSSSTVPYFAASAQNNPQRILPASPAITTQQPGIQIAQNLNPGVQLPLIDEAKTGLRAIPTAWPKLKVESIPISYPKCRITPVESSAVAAAAKK